MTNVYIYSLLLGNQTPMFQHSLASFKVASRSWTLGIPPSHSLEWKVIKNKEPCTHTNNNNKHNLIQLTPKDLKHRVIIDMVHGNLATSIHPRCEHNTKMICDAKIFHFKIDPKHIQNWHCKLVTQGMVARTISCSLGQHGQCASWASVEAK